MQTIDLKVKGMHCRACEMLVEQDLIDSGAVNSVTANSKTQTVKVDFDETKISIDQMGKRIFALGFEMQNEDSDKKTTYNKSNLKEFLLAVVIFAVLYLIVYFFNPGERFSIGFSNFSLSTAFLVGLTAGASTCIALVGGLILAISSSYNLKNQDVKTVNKLKPHLFFNLGRVLGFSLLGGVLGLFGSLFGLSVGFTGIITILVAFLMLFMGLKLIGIVPGLHKLQFSMPKSISRYFSVTGKNGDEYSNIKTMTLGALTFFLPCGFTQLMQTYAITTANFWQAAAIMGSFAIGTVPGLLGIGAVSAFIKGKYAGILFRVTGLVLIAFAVYNFSNGYNLSKAFLNTNNSAVIDSNSVSEKPIELIASFNVKDDLLPTVFSVKAGQKVKLNIDVLEDGQGCMSTIMIPGIIDDPKPFVKGKMVLEFTPMSKGVFPITCAMGVKRGDLKVE